MRKEKFNIRTGRSHVIDAKLVESVKYHTLNIWTTTRFMSMAQIK